MSQLHNHFQFFGPAHRRSRMPVCCWLSDGSVGGELGGPVPVPVPVRTEQSSAPLRDKPCDSAGSRGTWRASLPGRDGPNSAYEQLIAAGGEASASSSFLRIHPRHVPAKLWRCSCLPPPPFPLLSTLLSHFSPPPLPTAVCAWLCTRRNMRECW